MKKDDADRVNRRMEKKNKKFGGKGKVDKSLVAEGEKAKSKERVKLKQTGGSGAQGHKRMRTGFKPGEFARRKGPPKGK